MIASRIAFHMADLSGGGVERMRLSLIAELRARNIAVSLIVGKLAGSLAGTLPDDLDVIDLATASTIRSIFCLARVIRRLRPDILVSSLDHNNIAAMVAARLAGTGTRVVICQHNALSAERAMGWRYRAVPWLYWMFQRWAHGIVAVSHGVAKDLAAVAGIAPDRISTIYNPIIGPDFLAHAEAGIPHAWLADKRVPVFVFAGRLTEQKNPALLLEGFALLTAVLPARLIILGEGPLLTGLQAQAGRLWLDGHVAFCGFQANPLPWIAHADCLVLTSAYEGFGNVLIEALACGTAVVATDCPHGPREALMDGAMGTLVPIDDAQALAEAMARAVRQKPDKDRLRSRAASFTSAACADAHLALFDRLEPTNGNHRRPLGLALTALSAPHVIEKILTEPAMDAVHLVVTPNIDHVRLLRQKAFAAAYEAAHLVCPDGLPILAYARWRGLPLPERVTGCELFDCLAAHATLISKRTFLVVECKMTELAVRQWARGRGLTNLSVVTAQAGLDGNPTAQKRLLHAIRAARPDILVMTLGAPVSEIFVHRHRHDLPPCWALCIGQALRVYLGLSRRAPRAWQNAGLEWLWRLIQEPRRLSGRYVRAAAWFPIAVLQDILHPI